MRNHLLATATTAWNGFVWPSLITSMSEWWPSQRFSKLLERWSSPQRNTTFTLECLTNLIKRISNLHLQNARKWCLHSMILFNEFGELLWICKWLESVRLVVLETQKQYQFRLRESDWPVEACPRVMLTFSASQPMSFAALSKKMKNFSAKAN